MSNQLEELVFEDLNPIEIPLKLAGQQNVLKEADEAASIKFRNHQARCIEYGSDGKVSKINNPGEANSLLLSLCLFKVGFDRDQVEKHSPVPIDVIKKWRTSVVDKLSQKAKLMSGFEDEETEEAVLKQIEELQKKLEDVREKGLAKNSQTGTTGTSDSPVP